MKAHGYRSDHDAQILASTIRLRAAEETKSRFKCLIPEHFLTHLQKKNQIFVSAWWYIPQQLFNSISANNC